ncbi:MAG: ATP-grasp domain-containing protein, partial [Desulfobacteraceae bacterium]|nr:ATP-grasp domain-containing protein [Desulfobacteraceae bacterium]
TVTSSFDLVGVMAINDFGVRTASRISAARGLPGYDAQAALNVTNKIHMKRKWILAGLLTPRFTWAKIHELLRGKKIKWDNFPCIMKPAFAAGGSRGVFLVRSFKEMRQRLEESRSVYLDEEVIIEEYIQGTEHTIEVLIFNGQTHILSISDKENYSDNVSVVQNLYFPGRIGHRFKDRLRAIISQACQSLGLSNGCSHFEVLIRNQDIYLLEVGGRPGGGLNFFPICQLSTGYDYPLELARILTGKAPQLVKQEETVCLGWHFFATEQGILKKVQGFEKIRGHPNVVDAQLLAKVGQRLPDRSNDLARPGYFLVHGKDYKEIDSLFHEFKNMIEFEVEQV